MSNDERPDKWNRHLASGEAATDFIEVALDNILSRIEAIEKFTGWDILRRKTPSKLLEKDSKAGDNGKV